MMRTGRVPESHRQKMVQQAPKEKTRKIIKTTETKGASTYFADLFPFVSRTVSRRDDGVDYLATTVPPPANYYHNSDSYACTELPMSYGEYDTTQPGGSPQRVTTNQLVMVLPGFNDKSKKPLLPPYKNQTKQDTTPSQSTKTSKLSTGKKIRNVMPQKLVK